MCKQEDRQWALRRGLEEINKEIEAASRSGIASCWFPMGTRNERIIRLAAKEASLLNSRYMQACRKALDLYVLVKALACSLRLFSKWSPSLHL